MLNFYEGTTTTYFNNGVCYQDFQGDFIAESESKAITAKKIQITWENVEEISKKYMFTSGFWVEKKKKGRVIYIKDYSVLGYSNKICEWKTPIFNLIYEITFEKINPSIEKILQYPDGEKAIQYLVERGLSIKK